MRLSCRDRGGGSFRANARPEPMTDKAAPVTIDVERDRGVVLTWADGTTCRFGLEELRQHCPCAECRTRRQRNSPVWPPASSPRPLLNTSPDKTRVTTLGDDRRHSRTHPQPRRCWPAEPHSAPTRESGSSNPSQSRPADRRRPRRPLAPRRPRAHRSKHHPHGASRSENAGDLVSLRPRDDRSGGVAHAGSGFHDTDGRDGPTLVRQRRHRVGQRVGRERGEQRT